jgi:hypothetical protein
MVNLHCPESEEAQKGYMKKQRQNIRSTRVKETPAETENDSPPIVQKKEQDVYI